MYPRQNILKDISKYKPNFEIAYKEIENLAELSEPEFFSLGEKLVNVSTKAKEISQHAIIINELLIGETASKINYNLQSKLKIFERYLSLKLHQLSKSSNSIKSIQDKLGKFTELSRGIKKTIKNLNIHVIATRIENERLANQNSRFNILTDEVAKLTQNIDIQLLNMTRGVDEINTQVEKMFFQIEKLKTENLKYTREKLLPIKKTVTELWEKQKQSGEITKEIYEKMQDNCDNISGIVVSLQFHDIARQKIEHIVEGINDLVDSKTFDNNLVDNEDLKERCIYMINFCGLQSTQLNLTKDEICSAINKVAKRLSSIMNSTDVIYIQTEEIVEFIRDEIKDILKDTISGIELISDSLDDTANATDEITLTIKDTIIKLNTIIDNSKHINEIGLNIQLMAYNGLIQASNMGSDGVVLRVIANSIEHLSEASMLYIDKFDKVLQDIENSTNQITSSFNINKENRGIDSIVKDISSALFGFYDQLIYMHEEMKSKVSGLDKTSKTLNKEINNIISNITVGELFEQHINNAVLQMDEIKEQLGKYVCKDDMSESLRNNGDLKQKYTIASEHDVHENFFANTNKNKNNNGQIGSIEYVNEISDENIELF